MRIGDAKLDKLAYLKRIRVFLDPFNLLRADFAENSRVSPRPTNALEAVNRAKGIFLSSRLGDESESNDCHGNAGKVRFRMNFLAARSARALEDIPLRAAASTMLVHVRPYKAHDSLLSDSGASIQ